MPYDTHPSPSNRVYQAIGLSKGWITTHEKDADHGPLGLAIRWAKSQFDEIPLSTYQSPLVQPADTLAAIDEGKEKAVQLFSSEAIRKLFSDPTTQTIQRVFRLKRSDRLGNSLAFSEIQPGTSSLHLLEFLRNANADKSRSITLSNLLSLAVHAGASIADFYPDSHVLISNLASFLIRVHVQPDAHADLPMGRAPSLRDTWEAHGKRFPRVSHRSIECLDEGPLQRQSAMFLYGLFVLQYGPMVPEAPTDAESLKPKVRTMFEERFAVWPQQLCEFLHRRWEQTNDQSVELDYWTEEIVSIARRVGQCLLGQFPIASDLLH